MCRKEMVEVVYGVMASAWAGSWPADEVGG